MLKLLSYSDGLITYIQFRIVCTELALICNPRLDMRAFLFYIKCHWKIENVVACQENRLMKFSKHMFLKLRVLHNDCKEQQKKKQRKTQNTMKNIIV